jgi:peptide/nickel transport system substrate-binding protein
MTTIPKITIGQPIAYLSDPHLWIDSRAGLAIRFAQYESLVKYDREAKIVPGLACDWQVEKDARTWTFNLRSGVKFHDGSLMTAEDAAASIRRAVSPDMPGEYGTEALLASYLQDAEIRALDEHTLRIVTSGPMADLLDLLMYAVVLPKKSLADLSTPASGTGPYRLLASEDGKVSLERFAEYWAGPAPVEVLEFRAIPSREERVQAFLNGEVDIVTYLPLTYRKNFEDCPAAEIIERSTPLCVIFIFNASSGPCADARVRQALNYATNMDQIIAEVTHGRAFRLNGPLSRHHSGADPELPAYPFDPQKARQLLQKAGYGQGLTLTLDRPTVSPDESAELAAILRQQWAEVGVRLEVRVEENRELYAQNVRSKQIGDICVFDSSPLSTYRVLREKLNSKYAGPWWEGYHNPEVNAMMERAWATVDETERTRIFRQTFRMIRDDAPWLFLYSMMDMWVVRKSIQKSLPGWGAGIDGLVLFGQG